jgi:hypothetical protein
VILLHSLFHRVPVGLDIRKEQKCVIVF